MQANEITPALPFRQHTIFGVCEGIGEDFGFNPTFIRIPLAVAVLWSPTVAIGIYFALGLVVLASRLLFPNRGDRDGAGRAAAGRSAGRQSGSSAGTAARRLSGGAQ